MKTMRKLFAALLTFVILLSMTPSASASESDAANLVGEMITYFRYYQDAAATDIERLNAQLAEIDDDQAGLWQKITDYWIWVNSEMTINFDMLPDGLPEDDSLCIVVLGYALNSNGSMQEELLGRLQVALASAEKYPNAYILCTGGGTARNNPSATEADCMAAWLMEQGIEESRIIIENKSRTTAQNAQFSCEILREQYPTIAHLAVVTSDYHLYRGCSLFFAQACLSGCGYDIVGNAGFLSVNRGSESYYQQAIDMAQLAGVNIESIKRKNLSQLTGITVSCDPTLELGDDFEIIVTASYDTGFSRIVTDSSFISGFDPEQEGTQTITLSYTEHDITCTATTDIVVLPPPTEPAPETEPTEATLPETQPTETSPEPTAQEHTPSIVYPLMVLALLLVLLVIILKLRAKR